jgi:hypothetical protein
MWRVPQGGCCTMPPGARPRAPAGLRHYIMRGASSCIPGGLLCRAPSWVWCDHRQGHITSRLLIMWTLGHRAAAGAAVAMSTIKVPFCGAGFAMNEGLQTGNHDRHGTRAVTAVDANSTAMPGNPSAAGRIAWPLFFIAYAVLVHVVLYILCIAS